MQEAYSRLKELLDERKYSTADLVRRIADQGDRINAKSVYRLTDPEEPLEKVDMRVIAAVCEAMHIGIGDLLTFDEPEIIEPFDPAKRERMGVLMNRRHESSGRLSALELSELQLLVEEAEETSRRNMRRLANRRRRLSRSPKSSKDIPPDSGADAS